MRSNKLEKFKTVKRIILFTLALALTNCQQEENAVEQSQSSIQTVSINEAKAFLLTSQNNPVGKLSRNQIAGLDLEKITQEKLSNTDQLLTVIPFKRTNAERFDRILLLKVNNVIKSVVYKIHSDGSQITTPFSGKALIYDLEGNFITGFGVKNGISLVKYIKKNSNSTTNKATSDEDGGTLSEVIVFNRYKKNHYFEIADFGWGDNLSGGNGGGEVTWEQDPGAGDSGAIELANVVIIGPAKVITNIKEYLKCFDLSKGAELVIYVDQPIANSPDAYTMGGDVGHTFVAIQQGNIRRVVGYWPATSVDPITSPTDTKAFGNDENHYFDVSISTGINASQLANIINYATNTAPSTYNLNSYNCTDFGIAVGKLGGLNLNDSYGTWPGGGGSNPGQLGQNIRSMSTPANGTKQTAGANSASNKGTCN
ncbi:hypothetical protein ACHRV5_12630 [Flavobacterium sp. FlaQc-52]|jgi:hypothetical protein|uniref:hypothetical protein n=1 Tax=Flavobacterium sp. FlaQc-52 TaxID=3374185 RepID=UPI0037573838